MDLFAAGDGEWSFAGEVTVRENGPTGPVLGPKKKIHTAFFGPGNGIFGLGYSPGEVTLEPGRTYYIEVAASPPFTGFNPLRFVDPEDSYPDGYAYKGGAAQTGVDLEMTIMEYKETATLPTPTPVPPVHPERSLLENGDMEQGTTGTGGNPAPDFWDKWQLATTAFWYMEGFGRNDSRGARVIGGNINGSMIHGGLYQRVTGLDSSRSYQFSGWARSDLPTNSTYMTYLGYDLTGQTSNPLAQSVEWFEMIRVSDVWTQFVSEPVSPVGDSISVWTRGRNNSAEETFFADFDDLVLEEVEPTTPTPTPPVTMPSMIFR